MLGFFSKSTFPRYSGYIQMFKKSEAEVLLALYSKCPRLGWDRSKHPCAAWLGGGLACTGCSKQPGDTPAYLPGGFGSSQPALHGQGAPSPASLPC